MLVVRSGCMPTDVERGTAGGGVGGVDVEDGAGAAGGGVVGEGVAEEELGEAFAAGARYDGEAADVATFVGAHEVVVALAVRAAERSSVARHFQPPDVDDQRRAHAD
jgi:hypothetical protein